jgi:hypothetical protein
MDRKGRVGVGTRQTAGVIATTALLVGAIPMVSVGAATRDATIQFQLLGPGAAGAPLVLRAVSNDGKPGAAQRSVVAASSRTAGIGRAALSADPADLTSFEDDAGFVNFEAMVVVNGEPRFASFSRSWSGSAWLDRDTPTTSVPVVRMSTVPRGTSSSAVQRGPVRHPSIAPSVTASEVPCYWYDDSAGDRATKIGELHTGANTRGSFTYGRTSDSDVSVGYDYGSGWTLGGTGHVGNTKSRILEIPEHSNFHRQLRSDFRYIHWHLTLGPSCAGSSRWGKRYYKVTPSSWAFGSSSGAILRGPFCTSPDRTQRKEFMPGSKFYRGSSRALTYGAAAGAWGALLSATSGFSQFVDIKWEFGRNSKVHHYLCGRPNINTSKIVYAR